jgi:cation transport ATPase
LSQSVNQPEEENRRTRSSFDRLKHGFFMVALVIAIVVAMAGWAYALGWVALKLIRYV